jgi:hypothetical protein
MVRAQGSNGGFNETQGWCGAPNRRTASSSVTGFTLYAIASAIRLLAPLPEMQARFSEKIDASGTGTNDTQRLLAWKNLLVAAMPYQFSGYGRGHAPNQDLCALAAVFAMNEAYAALSGGAVLKTPAEVGSLESEIFYGRPAAAAASPNGRWFSDSGLLGEPGHGFYGYDANYGAGVSMEFLGALADRDPGAASFLASYASALQYFYVPDPGAYLGVYAENSVARRSTGSPMNVGMPAFGLITCIIPLWSGCITSPCPFLLPTLLTTCNSHRRTISRLRSGSIANGSTASRHRRTSAIACLPSNPMPSSFETSRSRPW